MNTNLADIHALPTPSEAPREGWRRHLHPVTGKGVRPRRSLLFLAVTCVLMVLAILAAQLWLSISISKGAYEANALILENRELARSERVLEQDVDRLASPQHLAERAIDLGMVQNSHPAYLKLATGTVVGSLTTNTSDARENLIPNAALTALNDDAVAEKSATSEKDEKAKAEQAEANVQAAAAGPLPWSGNLPAPETH